MNVYLQQNPKEHKTEFNFLLQNKIQLFPCDNHNIYIARKKNQSHKLIKKPIKPSSNQLKKHFKPHPLTLCTGYKLSILPEKTKIHKNAQNYGKKAVHKSETILFSGKSFFEHFTTKTIKPNKSLHCAARFSILAFNPNFSINSGKKIRKIVGSTNYWWKGKKAAPATKYVNKTKAGSSISAVCA